MGSPSKDDLIAQKKKLEAEHLRERREWNEYLHGEGVLIGHEHSLHLAQATKFKLLETKIEEMDRLLSGELKEVEVEAKINGQRKKLTICTPGLRRGENCIPNDSPVGQALLELKKGQSRSVESPGGKVMVQRLS